MYRARVENIDGKKVYAGGKWLICIGNKNINVGDMVWTDGRCVYGYNKVSQQPMVITSTGIEEDWGIPILFTPEGLSSSFERGAYIYTKNGLVYLNDPPYNYSISNNASGNVYRGSLGSKYNGQELLAFNVEGNNVYSITRLSEWSAATSDITRKTIYIKKNDEIIKVISNLDNIDLVWSFIENENNWCVITNSWDKSRGLETEEQYLGTYFFKHVHFYWAPYVLVDYNIYYDKFLITDTSDHFTKLFIYTPTEILNPYTITQHTLNQGYLNMASLTRERAKKYFLNVDDPPFNGTNRFGYTIKNINDIKSENHLSGLNIPLHNGFYFVINSIGNIRDHFTGEIATFKNIPDYMNISLFDDKDKLILTDNFTFMCYITICKINKNRYLMGVKNPTNNYVVMHPYTKFIDSLNNRMHVQDEEKSLTILLNGLYLVSENKTKLLMNGLVRNQKLQKMKNYMKWTENVKVWNSR